MAETYAPQGMSTQALARSPKYGVSFGLLAFLFLSILTAFAVYRQTPPGVASEAAALSEYSSGRAMRHLGAIGRVPHPIGSAEHAAVREYIINELTALGVQPEVQETSVVGSTRGVWRVATVRNIAATLKGTGGGKGVLLVGHYDTVPNAPGASDNGASVATLLETLRALKAGVPLRNDIIFLFTDGEEVGLLGAKAFVEGHPWARNVGLVLNFEARGVGGSVLMFETSEGNEWLVREFAKASPRPMANSLSYEIYKLLPNDTDLTVFKGASLPGLNFAYIDGPLLYHTRGDSLENLDERSLQHQGASALSLTRHFGDLELERPGAGNAVYFDLLGLALLHYPSRWVVPLSLLCAALFAAVAALGFRRGLTLKGLLAGAGLFVATAVLAVVSVSLFWWVVSFVQLSAGRALLDDLYRGKLYLAGFSLLAVAVTAALHGLWRRFVSAENLSAGALFCWLILLVPASLFLPGGTYLLAWPLVFGLLGLAYTLATKKEGESMTAARFVVLAACAVPAVVLIVPPIYQVFLALGLWQITAVAAVVALLCTLLVTHFGPAHGGGGWLLPTGAALAACALVGAAAFNSGFSRQYPKTDHLFYVLNADTGRAAWASADQKSDEWTVQFLAPDAARGPLKEYMPLMPYNFLHSPAPAAPLAPADLRVLDDVRQGDVRRLLVRVTSRHAAVEIAVPADAKVEVVGASVGGWRLEGARRGGGASPMSSWELLYWSPPAEGFDLALELKGDGPVPLKVLGRAYGLPEVAGAHFKPRPDYIVPSASAVPDSDQSLVTKSYSF